MEPVDSTAYTEEPFLGPYWDYEQDKRHKTGVRRVKDWVIFLAVATAAFLGGAASVYHHKAWHCSGDTTVIHNERLRPYSSQGREIRDLAPFHGTLPYRTEKNSHDYWDNKLYFGEPNPESDEAWMKLQYPRGFRIYPAEAEAWGIKPDLRISPDGKDYAGLLGVIHNLHCLRRMRQALYPDYYYPNATQEEWDRHRKHSIHCFESIRTSLLCQPDLNFYPMYRTDNPYHRYNLNPELTRECVDWEAVQKLIAARDYTKAEII